MTDEELKKKCTERAKIFQQAMESCHSSSPIDCIEWFADSIAELEKENAELKELLDCKNCCELEESECESCAEFGHFRCKGKAQLTKAKEIIEGLMRFCRCFAQHHTEDIRYKEAEQFLSEVEKNEEVQD